MFPSFQIAIALFQFSYWIGLLFSLDQVFFGRTFVKERGWNALIPKVIQGVRKDTNPQKPNENTSGLILEHDFKSNGIQNLMKCF